MSHVSGVARKWALAVEGLVYTNYAFFKEAIVKKFCKEAGKDRNEDRELYNMLLGGPKEKGLEEYIYEVMIQFNKANVNFESLKEDLLKIFPLQLRDKVREAKDWIKILGKIEENKEWMIQKSVTKISETKSIYKESTKEDKKPGDCFNCGKKHFRKDCPKNKKTAGSMSNQNKEVNITRNKMKIKKI
jgi:hypothetical protein